MTGNCLPVKELGNPQCKGEQSYDEEMMKIFSKKIKTGPDIIPWTDIPEYKKKKNDDINRTDQADHSGEYSKKDCLKDPGWFIPFKCDIYEDIGLCKNIYMRHGSLCTWVI